MNWDRNFGRSAWISVQANSSSYFLIDFEKKPHIHNNNNKTNPLKLNAHNLFDFFFSLYFAHEHVSTTEMLLSISRTETIDHVSFTICSAIFGCECFDWFRITNNKIKLNVEMVCSSVWLEFQWIVISSQPFYQRTFCEID